MFGFPGLFEDPYSQGGFRPQRRQQRQQPYHHQQQHQRRAPSFGDIFGREDADTDTYYNPYNYYGTNPMEEARVRKERQRRAEMQRQMEDAQRARLAKQKQENHKRRLLLQKYTKAAVVIQRAFRSFLQAKRKAEQQEAASVITRTIKSVPKIKKAKKVRSSLERLVAIRTKLRKLVASYYEKPQGYKNNLYFVDQVEKLIFQLDDIQHYKEDFVRAVRKGIVKEAQEGLAYADVVVKMFKRKIKVVISALRMGLTSKHAQEEERAAKVILRVLQGAPRIQRARQVATALRRVKDAQDKLEEARASFLEALSNASDAVSAATNVMDETKDDGSSDDTVLATSISECKALLSKPIKHLGEHVEENEQEDAHSDDSEQDHEDVNENDGEDEFFDAQQSGILTTEETKNKEKKVVDEVDEGKSNKKKNKRKRKRRKKHNHKNSNKRGVEDSHVITNPQPTKKAPPK